MGWDWSVGMHSFQRNRLAWIVLQFVESNEGVESGDEMGIFDGAYGLLNDKKLQKKKLLMLSVGTLFWKLSLQVILYMPYIEKN